jgi:hypothetical protein
MHNLVRRPDQSSLVESLRTQYVDEKDKVADTSLASGPDANVHVRTM